MRLFFLSLLLLSPAGAFAAESGTMEARRIIPFDTAWRFFKGEAPDAQDQKTDDTSWRTLELPHDWSIEGPFSADNPTGGAGAFLPADIGWYRRHFVLPTEWTGKRVFVEFDGVMANSDVWINGAHLGKRPYGYVSFRYELTEYLRPGLEAANLLAVRADNSGQPASRWYTGAGIYRHVRLIAVDPVHLESWATFVSTPTITARAATVRIETSITNQATNARPVSLRVNVFAPAGKLLKTVDTATQTIEPGKSTAFDRDVELENPERWDLNHPALYRVVVEVRSGGKTIDDERVFVGIRECHFDPATGFWLNGQNFKIKGVCLHGDASALGTAVPLLAWARRLTILRKLGVNAIRTAHNPPAPEFLDLCDRMGFLVMDEMFDCWTVAKNPYDYHLYFDEWSLIDTRDSVRRDRNHPCIIAYSAGNEIHDTPNTELAKKILGSLVEVFHREDPTRPVTQALFRPNVSHDYDNGLADMLDVVGQNYREKEILAAHAAKSTRKILGTENGHDQRVWLAMRDNPFYAGQFIWAGIDYLGESPRWPAIGFNFGLLDRTGLPRALGYERQSWWSSEPMVHVVRRTGKRFAGQTDPGYEPVERRPQVLFSDWTPRSQEPHKELVEVYSNCDEVELFLNGKTLGALPRQGDAGPRIWHVDFAPGVLKAVAKNGKTVVTQELRTAGKPVKLLLVPDKTKLVPAWDDIVYVEATVLDENGVIVPDGADLVRFEVTGPGVIAAVDSADNTSHESFQAKERRAYQGRCFALVKASSTLGGTVIVKGSAEGLEPSSCTLTTVASGTLSDQRTK